MGLWCFLVPSRDCFVLTVGLVEPGGRGVTRYGATAGAGAGADGGISVFYAPVSRPGCPTQCEPLSLPTNCWLLPGQAVCLLLCLALLCHQLPAQPGPAIVAGMVLALQVSTQTTVGVVLISNCRWCRADWLEWPPHPWAAASPHYPSPGAPPPQTSTHTSFRQALLVWFRLL